MANQLFSLEEVVGHTPLNTKDRVYFAVVKALNRGLDFDNVSLVGILNADMMLNFPDFRAHERAFQLMVQVSGRAGRSKKQGKVLIQTYNPYHQILQQVSSTDYAAMYKEQLEDRWQYHYPPYYRLVKITLKHKDYQKVDAGIIWLSKALQNIFREHVLGPSEPAVSRIRNQYIKNVMIKIPPKQSLRKTKKEIHKIKNTFQAVADFIDGVFMDVWFAIFDTIQDYLTPAFNLIGRVANEVGEFLRTNFLEVFKVVYHSNGWNSEKSHEVNSKGKSNNKCDHKQPSISSRGVHFLFPSKSHPKQGRQN